MGNSSGFPSEEGEPTYTPISFCVSAWCCCGSQLSLFPALATALPNMLPFRQADDTIWEKLGRKETSQPRMDFYLIRSRKRVQSDHNSSTAFRRNHFLNRKVMISNMILRKKPTHWGCPLGIYHIYITTADLWHHRNSGIILCFWNSSLP